MAEDKKKYCPIDTHPQSDGMCKKEYCAWWNKESEACAVLAISNFIAVSWLTVDAVLGEERDKKSKKKEK